MSQLTLFDCIRRQSSVQKRPRIESTDNSANCMTTADLEVRSTSTGSTCSNSPLELALPGSIDIDTVSSPVLIDSTSNEASPIRLSSSPIRDDCDVSIPFPTVSKQCGHKASNAVVLTTHPGDIAQSPAFLPAQPKHIRFPTTTYSNRARSFNPAWYDTYDWLEYSVKLDACFCYPCRLFGSQSSSFSSRPESAFTTNGFKDWKHATGKNGILNGHNNCITHKQSVIAWKQFQLNAKQGTSISEQLENTRAEVIQKNRHYLKTIIEVLLLCSKQEIALRGHRESSESLNRGNFLEILGVIARHDKIVLDKMTNGPRNACYTSPEIQNELLQIMGGVVRERICMAVRKAGVYSVLADETKDCSKQEQLAIVIRYVDEETAVQHEHFITYVQATSLNAQSLSKYILDTLRNNGLDPTAIVSQAYDGASVMSGKCSGVQQRIREVAPEATYVHCYAHCLNLALVDSTKHVSDAADFFALMETLYVFISSAKVHAVYTHQQSVLHPSKPIHQLQRLSDTRWACRYFAVEAVCTTYDAILATLQTIVDGDDRTKAIEATGILSQVRSFKFLIALVLFWRILFCTKSLSDQLQGISINMAKAADLVNATLDTLTLFRSDLEWEKHYKYTTDVAALHNISVSSPRLQRQRQLPRRFDDAVIMQSTGARETMATAESYKISLYFPILDAIITELRNRFDSKNLDLMRAIQCCNPLSAQFLDIEHLLPLVESYSCLNKEYLTMECRLAKQTLQNKEMQSINDVLQQVYLLKAAFPNLVKLLQISLTIAVSTAECERSFSALKRIKTFLRSTMSEQRLTDLALLSIEKQLSQNLPLDEVIDRFAVADKNRKIVLN